MAHLIVQKKQLKPSKMHEKAPQGALLLDDLPQQSPEYWDALASRHSLTGSDLAAMLGRTGSDQVLRNAWSRIKTGRYPLHQHELALLLLQLGEHPTLRLTPK